MGNMYCFWIDESIKEVTHQSQKPIIAVGGYYIPIQTVQFCISSWQELKQSYGIGAHSEIKWNLPEDHPTRKEIASIELNYWNFKSAAMKMLNSWQFLICVVTVLKDKRHRKSWNTKNFRASCTDFYTEGLKYSLQRFAEDSLDSKWDHCFVVCDRFDVGKQKFVRGAVRKGPNLIQKFYHQLYCFGVDGGPHSQSENHILKDLNFHPSIMMSDASHDDLLQIADFVVGCTADWVFDTLYRKKTSFSKDCMKVLSERFRNISQNDQGFFQNGLILYPFENDEWDLLRSSLK